MSNAYLLLTVYEIPVTTTQYKLKSTECTEVDLKASNLLVFRCRVLSFELFQ